jgi:hypothetical protein
MVMPIPAAAAPVFGISRGRERENSKHGDRGQWKPKK